VYVVDGIYRYGMEVYGFPADDGLGNRGFLRREEGGGMDFYWILVLMARPNG
jgi:hypothetical protein